MRVSGLTTLTFALCGLAVTAQGQLMKMLVSTDGVNFADKVDAHPGDTVQVLVTVSYVGTNVTITGLGSANFQPTVSNWHAADTLLPLREGGNTSPSDGSGMVLPQFYSGVSAGSSTASYGHIQAGYVPETFGRVLPMGRVPLEGAGALTGFVHDNPDGSGTTYLRIAQASNTAWIGQAGNTAGSAGVVASQYYAVGRTEPEPDFWGNREVTFDPDLGWFTSSRIPANDVRRVNVEVFRFGMVLDGSSGARDMVVDAPVDGQQMNSTGLRYIGYYSSIVQTNPGVQLPVAVQTGLIHVVPAPATIAVIGIGGFGLRRGRR